MRLWTATCSFTAAVLLLLLFLSIYDEQNAIFDESMYDYEYRLVSSIFIFLLLMWLQDQTNIRLIWSTSLLFQILVSCCLCLCRFLTSLFSTLFCCFSWFSSLLLRILAIRQRCWWQEEERSRWDNDLIDQRITTSSWNVDVECWCVRINILFICLSIYLFSRPNWSSRSNCFD